MYAADFQLRPTHPLICSGRLTHNVANRRRFGQRNHSVYSHEITFTGASRIVFTFGTCRCQLQGDVFDGHRFSPASALQGDMTAVNESYKVFAIPVPNTWFALYFKKESVQQLGWDYEPELENEKKSLLTITRMMGRGRLLRFQAHCKSPDHDPTANLAPRKRFHLA